MSRARSVSVAACVVAGLATVAVADPSEPGVPCDDAVVDPVPTPVRDVAIDAQRSACLHDELGAHLRGAALIDTPGFYGAIGGDLRLFGRMRLGRQFELDGGVQVMRYTFVQNAVNTVTKLQLGPLSIGGAWGGDLGEGARIALVALVEVPYTREQLETMHASASLGGVVSAALTSRSVLHARLGLVTAYASSAGGDTSRFALRAGADVARRIGEVLALHAGADVQAGWYRGLDHVNLRAGAHWRFFGGPWRGMVGLAAPVGGEERTDLILDLGIIRHLH